MKTNLLAGRAGLLLALTLSAATTAFAQTAPTDGAKAEVPVPSAAPAAIYSIGGFDLTGHIDVGYSRLSGSGKFANGLNDRVFDFTRNRTVLQAIDLQLAKLPDQGFGGLLDVTIGKDADTIAAYGTIDRARGPANGVNKRFDATQAYAYFGAAPFSLIVGKFVTNAGAEVIKSDGDTNYSRSILFGYAIPFTHTGVRATYKINDQLTVLGGVNQGWDAFKDTNGDKTLELGAMWTPTEKVSLTGSLYSGKERVTNYPRSDAQGTRNLVDLVGSFKITDRLTFVANYDYGTQEQGSASGGQAKWQGVAGYLNYQFNDQWRLSLRGEYFDDKDGYRTGFVQKWKETTLTVAYLPTKNIELRGEIRGDRSDHSTFLKSDGVSTSNTQRSAGLEFLYKF